MHMSTPILFIKQDGTTRTLYVKNPAQAEELVKRSREAESLAILSQQVLDQINQHIQEWKGCIHENR